MTKMLNCGNRPAKGNADAVVSSDSFYRMTMALNQILFLTYYLLKVSGFRLALI